MLWKPNRRWFRFSLGTLLLAVTIFCVWLGWQASIVRERNSLRDRFKDRVSFLDRVNDDFGELFGVPASRPPGLSWIREKMGDRWIDTILCSGLASEDVERLQVAFPEAIVDDRTSENPFGEDNGQDF
jgi:hypothetical protein